ncbi:hypothetical protein EC957_002354 [Mortierella hygrophila]|uniref:Eisosome component PIL1-domain-containing protein n=1 Tax=Mortierella hygrophila TaxID=979708 RepID=A0A9P6F5A4_9FUNG|nr:hypothetical protein EC957_002354 [Mortierella hygrophila]
MDMINSGRSRLHDGARYAAGSFMNPLTNAIGEQRRLVDSLSAVSKARVEECKHMMAWSKSQDVLLKLNLLIRKISDYELRFGSQYEDFREKIKVLRTRDDTLCEMGRFQNDIQTKLVEKGKSGFKAWLKKDAEETSSKKEPEVDPELVQYKRQLIKTAYAEQLDAVIELGKKMQIIGEHGKHLLEHIDLSRDVHPYADGRETEGVLQAARIALENWSQGTTVDNHQDNLVNPTPEHTPTPTPTVSVSDVSAAAAATNGSAKKSATSSSSPSSSAKPATKVELAATVPPLPPRTPDRIPSSESLEPRRVQKGRARAAEEEQLRRLEELELEEALAMSLAAASPVPPTEVSDLVLTPEELRFISEQESLAFPKPAGTARVVRSPQSVEIGGHIPSQRRPPSSQATEEERKIAKAVSTPPLEELGGSRTSSESMDDQSTSASRREAHTTKHAPLESMGPEPEALLESMGCDTSVAYESMGDSGLPPLAHENLHLQTVLSQQRKLNEQQQPSPFPPSPELQYLQVQPSPQQHKQTLQILQSGGTLSLSTPMSSNHSSPMIGNYQPNVPYKPTTTYVPHPSPYSNKPRNRNSGPITPPTSEGLSPSASQLLQQRQRQHEFQQQLRGDEGRPISLTAKHSLQQQQELQKKLQDFYFTTNEQENTERYQQENRQQSHSGHRQQPSGSWDYHPEDNDDDYQYKEEYHTLHR